MKIHTDELTAKRVTTMLRANVPGVRLEVETHGSRSRARRLDVKPDAEPMKGRRLRMDGEGYGMSFDEWGILLDAIFRADPHAIAGPYRGRADFRETTAYRYDDLTWFDRCEVHRWRYPGNGYQRECTRCGALIGYSTAGFSA